MNYKFIKISLILIGGVFDCSAMDIAASVAKVKESHRQAVCDSVALLQDICKNYSRSRQILLAKHLIHSAHASTEKELLSAKKIIPNIIFALSDSNNTQSSSEALTTLKILIHELKTATTTLSRTTIKTDTDIVDTSTNKALFMQIRNSATSAVRFIPRIAKYFKTHSEYYGAVTLPQSLPENFEGKSSYTPEDLNLLKETLKSFFDFIDSNEKVNLLILNFFSPCVMNAIVTFCDLSLQIPHGCVIETLSNDGENQLRFAIIKEFTPDEFFGFTLAYIEKNQGPDLETLPFEAKCSLRIIAPIKIIVAGDPPEHTDAVIASFFPETLNK
ncbi:MAG: hypothetical protein LBO73_04485 [Holosporaceae bacterium]|nr:hypothetical protein [Holosporaceae bacterium]